MGAIASQITSLTVVYSTVYSHANQRKHQSSASLAFVWGNSPGPVNSPHKGPVTRKMFPFDDVIMYNQSPHHWTISTETNCFSWHHAWPITRPIELVLCFGESITKFNWTINIDIGDLLRPISSRWNTTQRNVVISKIHLSSQWGWLSRELCYRVGRDDVWNHRPLNFLFNFLFCLTT